MNFTHTRKERAKKEPVREKRIRRVVAPKSERDLPERPRMTSELAEKLAIGDPKGPKFDGVAFLKTLKK